MKNIGKNTTDTITILKNQEKKVINIKAKPKTTTTKIQDCRNKYILRID